MVRVHCNILRGRLKQLRHLRLRQPYAVALHADFQTGLAVGRPVNDDLPVVHRNKDTNKPEASGYFPMQLNYTSNS